GLTDLDDLGLGREPAQRRTMQYPRPVPLKCAAFLAMGILHRLGRESFGCVPAVVARSPACADLAHLLSLPPASSSTAAAPASSLAAGARNGEPGTSPSPARWKNRTDSGSPPCSPHTPTFRSGLVSRPSAVAILTSLPIPSTSSVSNGETPKMPISM